MHGMRTIARIILILLLLLLPGGNLFADQQTLTLTLPAPALLAVLQNLQPIPIMLDQKRFSGHLAIQSIDSLQIHDNDITLHGTVQGDKLAMNTMIAGRKLKLRLGSLSLPMTCDLRLRLDQKKQAIFIMPQLKDTGNKIKNNDPLAGLLNGLGGNREYQLSLAEIDRLVSESMGRTVSLGLRPVLLKMKNNTLTLGFRAANH